MARRTVSYSIRLFRGNRRVAIKRLRYADSFELWYGKRRVLARRKFPYKRVGERRDLLAELISSIERKRLRILKKRRIEYRRRRQEKARKVVESRVRRARETKKPRLREFWAEVEATEGQLPVFPKLYAEEPVKARKSIVEDTIIIPIEPEDDTYDKRIVDKVLRNNLFGQYHLAILDFTLREDQFILMSAENFSETYHRAYIKFIPSIVQYFQDVKASSDMFILRLKFLHKWEKSERFTPQGISFHRMGITTQVQMIDLFRRTFRRLFGDPDDPYTTKNMRRTNYLAGENFIYLTGFTLEAADVR